LSTYSSRIVRKQEVIEKKGKPRSSTRGREKGIQRAWIGVVLR
jgi:hypothetical protein